MYKDLVVAKFYEDRVSWAQFPPLWSPVSSLCFKVDKYATLKLALVNN